MTKAEQSLSRFFTMSLIGATTLLDMLLGLDAGRAFLQRHAVDGRAARHAQRLHRVVDAARDGFGRIGIDDEDAVGMAATWPLNCYSTIA